MKFVFEPPLFDPHTRLQSVLVWYPAAGGKAHNAPVMRFAPEAHRRVANIILRATKASYGTKKLRLQDLACAHQLRTIQLEDEIDEAVYEEAVVYFTAGIATFSGGSADLRGLVGALISCLANDGLDAEEIRAVKGYIRRFVEDVAAGREIIGQSAD